MSLCGFTKAFQHLKISKDVVGGSRGVSTSAALLGKRNFRKFHLGNKRGNLIFKRNRNAGLFPDIPIESEVRPNGYAYGSRYHVVPEMVPEFVVPDLTNCPLKPYVSYRVQDVYQEPFTAHDLFYTAYVSKMEKDFSDGNLDENGNPKNPSDLEKITPDEAWTLARKCGSDIFSERIPRQWECLEIDVAQWKKERAAKFGYEYFHDFLKHPYPPVEEGKKAESSSANDASNETVDEKQSPKSS